MTFGSRLKALRLKNNMTQLELSKMLFVTRQAVTKWENDKSTPEDETLNRISEIFNVSKEYLLNGEKKDEPSKPKRHFYLKLGIALFIGFILILTLIITPIFVFGEDITDSYEEKTVGCYVSFDVEVELESLRDLYTTDLAYTLHSENRYFKNKRLIIPEGEFSCAYVYLINWDESGKYFIDKPLKYNLDGGLKEYVIIKDFDIKMIEMVPLETITINYIDLKHENIIEETIYIDDKGKLASSIGRIIDSFTLELVRSPLIASYTVEAKDINGNIKKYNVFETKTIILYIKDFNKPFINTSYEVRFEI